MTSASRPAPRRPELLDVARTLFYERGYTQTTLQDIADRMGFTKAAVYYYAKNKEELLVEIYAAIVDPAIARARLLAAEPGIDGAARFLTLIKEHLETFLNNIEANAVFEVHNSSLSDAGKRRIQRLGRTYNDILRGVYEEGVADGSIAPGNPRIVVNALIGMCNSAHRWYHPRGKAGVDEVVAELLGIVASAVRQPGFR